MTRFAYRALSAAGDIVAGEIDGSDLASVIGRLQEQALLPIEAIEKRPGGGFFNLELSFGGAKGFPRGALALFIQQLTRLLKASLPLDRALEILTTLVEDKQIGRAH